MSFYYLKKRVLCGLVFMPTFVLANINPLDLDALLLRATQTHPLVNAAKADEMASAEGVRAAKLGMLPTPTMSVGHDKNDGLISTVAIRQPLWTGGRLTAQINQSMYDNKAASDHVFEQQNTVAKNTIDVWRGYIYAVALQELYADSLARLNEFEAMMERRVAQGVSAKIELDLVKNRIYQDQNSQQNAIEQERVAAARLSQLIGETLGEKKYNITMKSLTDYVKAQILRCRCLTIWAVIIPVSCVSIFRWKLPNKKQKPKRQGVILTSMPNINTPLSIRITKMMVNFRWACLMTQGQVFHHLP